MSEVPRAGARRRLAARLSCLLATGVLAACSEQAAHQPPPSPPAAPAATVLGCMPGTLASLQLPLREGFALAHGQVRTSEPLARCVLSLFGTRRLKSPLAFDRAYAGVFTFHEEDGTLDLGGLAPAQLQLFRVGATPAAAVWLLRMDVGSELEPAHRDVLFSTSGDGAALVDQLLVGSLGMLYRRDYDIESAHAFAIQEDTGRGPERGPRYRARYRVEDDGRFALVSSRVLPPDAPAR